MRLSGKLLLLLVLAVSLGKGQMSFTYSSPVCPSAGTLLPVQTNWVSGGNYIGSSGLSVNFSTGAVNVTGSVPGSHTVTYFPAGVTATLQILPAPSYTISASNNPICSNQVLTLTATGSGATAFSWSSGGSSATTTDTPFQPVTTYSLFTVSAGNCTAMAVKNVTLIQQPTVSISGDPTVCVGYSYTMAASAPSGATYTWSGPGLSSNLAAPSVSVLNNSTYSVIVSVQGCTNSATHFVTALPIPTVSVIGPSSVCAGSGITLMGQGASTFTWITNGTPLVSDTIFISPPPGSSAVGYTITGMDFNGCSTFTTGFITVYATPTVSISGSHTYCAGSSQTLFANGAGAVTFTWVNGQQGPSVLVNIDRDTSITVQGSSSRGCTSTSAPFTVSFSPTPTITANNATVCVGSQATLQASSTNSTGDNYTYVWYPSNTVGQTITPAPFSTVTYTVKAFQGICSGSATSKVEVIKLSPAVGIFSYSTPVCSGGTPLSPSLNPSFTQGGTFFSYAPINVNATTGAVDLSNITTGFYSVTYTLAAQGAPKCINSTTTTASFFVNKTVELAMSSPVLEILPGQSVKLYNTGGVNSYQWTPSEGLDCPSCQTPNASPTHDMQYCLSSSQACVVGSCVFVDVLCINNGDLSLPNAFTPNNDGKNDKFCLQGWAECSEEFNVTIFDRWGNVVYESQNPNFCWDGVFNGSPLPSAVYAFVINARFEKEEPIRKSGNITLIR